MFRVVSIAVFLITMAWMILRLRSNPQMLNVVKRIQFLRSVFQAKNLRRLGVWRNVAYATILVFFALLAISGFLPQVIFGAHLSGSMLLIHVTIAPFFALTLAILVVLTAHKHRFLSHDRYGLRTLFNSKNRQNIDIASKNPTTLQKICFWLATSLSLPLILSILLSMSTFFDAESQKSLLNIHRYSALLFFIAIIVHTGSLLTGDSQTSRETGKQPDSAEERSE